MATVSARLPAVELRPPRVRLSDVEERLLQCFDTAPPDPSDAFAALQDAARDYAHSLRKQGLRPEQFVVALKQLLCCHGGFSSHPSLLEQQREEVVSFSSTKYGLVLNWCIEAYYDS